MPPAAFIATATPSTDSSSGFALSTFITPSSVQPGDTLLVLTASANGDSIDINALPAGWSRIGHFVSGSTLFGVCRREVTATEPASHTLQWTSITATMFAVMIVYRGLDNTRALVAGGVAVVASSTSYPCPGGSTTSYSDVYIGVCFANAVAVTFTPPGGTRERFDASVTAFAANASIEIFELTPEATTTLTARTSTASGSGSGLAGSIIVATTPPTIAKPLPSSSKGAIGLTTIGV